MWLIIGLAAAFSVAATVWVGSIARENVLEQHVRRLSLETDQLSSDLGQALAARLDAIRAAERMLQATDGAEPNSGFKDVFDELVSAYPQLDWIAVADADGEVRGYQWRIARCERSRASSRATGSPPLATAPGSVSSRTAERGPTDRGLALAPRRDQTRAALGDMAAPVRDANGRVVGVIAAHLSWRQSAPSSRTADRRIRSPWLDAAPMSSIATASCVDRTRGPAG